MTPHEIKNGIESRLKLFGTRYQISPSDCHLLLHNFVTARYEFNTEIAKERCVWMDFGQETFVVDIETFEFVVVWSCHSIFDVLDRHSIPNIAVSISEKPIRLGY